MRQFHYDVSIIPLDQETNQKNCMYFFFFFFFFVQKPIFWYSVELPCLGNSCEYKKDMFGAKIKITLNITSVALSALW